MLIDQKQFRKALRAATLVSKRAPKAARNTRVEVTEKSVRVLATDGALWYQRVLPIREPFYGSEAAPTCRAFTVGSDALVKAARKLTDLDALAPNAKDEPLYGIDPRTDDDQTAARPLPLYLLAAVAFSASRGDRPHLEAVQLSWENGDLWARATDGHRATRARTRTGHPGLQVTVPLRAVDLALEIFSREADLLVQAHEGVIRIGSSDEILIVRALESEYPPFDAIFPQAFTGTARSVRREEAESAARAVGAFSGHDVDVAFTVGDERVALSGLPAGVREGAAGCWTPAEVEGAGSTRVDAYYLAEALEHAPDDKVTLSVAASADPVLHLRADSARMHWEHLIMPIRR